MRQLLSLFVLPVLLATAHSATELHPGEDLTDILGHAFFFVDLSGQLRADEIDAMQNSFQPVPPGDFINIGMDSGVVWIRFEVHNAGAETGEWVLSLNRALTPVGEIYLADENGLHLLLDSSSASRSTSYKKFRTLAASFKVDAQQTARLYIRYRGANWSALDPTLSTAATMSDLTTQNQAIFFLLLGGIGSLVAYGSVAFVFLGRQIVVMYALAQLSFFVFYAHLAGFTTVYLWPDAPELGTALSPLSFAIFIAAMVQFARRFFDTHVTLPVLDYLLRGFVIAACLAISMVLLQQIVPTIDRRIGLGFIYVLIPLVWLTLPALAIYATLNWHRDNWPIAVAWILMAVFLVTIVLAFSGMMTFMPLKKHIYGAAVYGEALFLAAAIALRIRRLREERADAERRMNQSLKSELASSQRAVRLANEREWAIADLAEKGRLLLTTGHDTRQMISALRHYAHGLERNPHSSRVEQAGREIAQIADNLNEVLATAIEASASGGMGDHVLALELVEPDQVLQPLRLIHGGSAAEKNIDLRLLSNVRSFVADRVLLSRVLGNFISNAIKYTESGKILVTCRPQRPGVRFQVYDTGIGMSTEALKRCLDPASGAVHFGAAAEGSGTGLHIAKDIAARMGGTISAKSRFHQGSVFALYLPEAEAMERSFVLGFADTDAVQRQTMLEIAKAVDCKIVYVSSPSEQTSDFQMDVLLIDQHFGGTDKGIEIALSHKESGTPVVISTYDRSIEARIKLAEVAQIIVYKPLNVALVRSAIAEAFNKTRM